MANKKDYPFRQLIVAAMIIGAIVIILAVAWWLIVPAADWLARHDVGTAQGTALINARNNARGTLLTLTAGVVAAGALVFTARNFVLSRRMLELTEHGQRRSFELTEQAQVTDRYTKAIEQLGSDKLDIRIGGIYALERIALDSVRDHPTIMEVLSTFVREHSRNQQPTDSGSTWLGETGPKQHPSADIHAALTVLGRRNKEHDNGRINLTDADLTGADLNSTDLSEANLTRVNLTDAHLFGANLTRAWVALADLTGALLLEANLTGASFHAANLTRTAMVQADLTDADLSGAKIAKTVFTEANLTGARWGKHPIPEGWTSDADGRLRRAGA